MSCGSNHSSRSLGVVQKRSKHVKPFHVRLKKNSDGCFVFSPARASNGKVVVGRKPSVTNAEDEQEEASKTPDGVLFCFCFFCLE